jgi:hypothetical protein
MTELIVHPNILVRISIMGIRKEITNIIGVGEGIRKITDCVKVIKMGFDI